MRIAKKSFADTNSLDVDNCTKGTAFKNCNFSFRDFIIIKLCTCLQNLIDNDYVEFTCAIFVRFCKIYWHNTTTDFRGRIFSRV
jgi:hypothetical protein